MLDVVSWRIPQKVLYSQFSGTVHLQDLQEMMRIGYEMIDSESSAEGIHGVVDVSRCEQYARDLMNLSAMKALSRPHPRTGWVIMINPAPHPVMQFISASVIKLLKVNYAMVKSDTEAMAMLQHVDRGLATMS